MSRPEINAELMPLDSEMESGDNRWRVVDNGNGHEWTKLCPCVLYDQDEDPDTDTCCCGHAVEEHTAAPGGHPGECSVVDS